MSKLIEDKFFSIASNCETTLTVIFIHQEEDSKFSRTSVLYVFRSSSCSSSILEVLEQFFEALEVL
jgi:hypothetical protein